MSTTDANTEFDLADDVESLKAHIAHLRFTLDTYSHQRTSSEYVVDFLAWQWIRTQSRHSATTRS